MKLLVLTLLTLAADYVCAFGIMNPRNTPLKIKLTPLSNSKLHVAARNTGSQGYNLFHTASILDGEAPVDKLMIHRAATPAPFHGVFVQVSTTNLSETQFIPVKPGQIIETEIDIASLYDVEVSGRYTIHAAGSLAYAEIGSTILTGRSVAYSSNTIVMDIDGEEASKVPYLVEDSNQKRTKLSCSSTHVAVIKQALKNCAMLAKAAAKAARAGKLMNEYFKSTSKATISTVSKRFDALAKECASSTSGKSSISCFNTRGLCSKEGYIAYTSSNKNVITLCDIFYTRLPALTNICDAQDQASTIVHETTHCAKVNGPYTLDYAYGTDVRGLSAAQAIKNADTYRMYAGAVHNNCRR